MHFDSQGSLWMSMHFDNQGSLRMSMHFDRDSYGFHAFCQGSLRISVHFDRHPQEFQCNLIGIPMDSTHVDRDPQGFQCISIKIPRYLRSRLGSAKVQRDTQGSQGIPNGLSKGSQRIPNEKVGAHKERACVFHKICAKSMPYLCRCQLKNTLRNSLILS